MNIIKIFECGTCNETYMNIERAKECCPTFVNVWLRCGNCNTTFSVTLKADAEKCCQEQAHE